MYGKCVMSDKKNVKYQKQINSRDCYIFNMQGNESMVINCTVGDGGLLPACVIGLVGARVCGHCLSFYYDNG